MNIEKMLEDELRVVAGELDVPPAPVVELVREGNKARNRSRKYVAGLAAAAVAVVATGLALADGDPRADDDGPTTPGPGPTTSPTRIVDGLPVGEPPTLPWIDNNRGLHIGDTVIDGQFLDVTGHGSWVSASRLDGGDSAAVNIVDGEAVLALGNLSPPGAVSPDGRWWATVRIEDDGRHSIVRYDAENPDDRPVHDLGQPGPEADGLAGVGGIDNRGRVYAADSSGAIMWVPETDAVVELPWETVGVGPEGPMLRKREGEAPFLTVMADDGTIESQLTLPDVVDDTVSPAGTWTAWRTDHRGRDLQKDVLFYGRLDAVTVQELATGQRTTIPFPKGTDLSTVRWEDEGTVLLTVTIDRGAGTRRYARCDVVAASCEWAGLP